MFIKNVNFADRWTNKRESKDYTFVLITPSPLERFGGGVSFDFRDLYGFLIDVASPDGTIGSFATVKFHGPKSERRFEHILNVSNP
jgi:hypothetical protein